MPEKLEEKQVEERTPDKGEPTAKGEPDPKGGKGEPSKGETEPTKPAGKEDSGKEVTGKEDVGAVINPESLNDGSESSNDISNVQDGEGDPVINPDSATFDNDESATENSLSQEDGDESEAVSEEGAEDSDSSNEVDASNNGVAPDEEVDVSATDSDPSELDDPPMGELPEGFEEESDSSEFDDIGSPSQGEPEKGTNDEATTGPQLPTHGGEVDIDAPEFVASDAPPELIDPRASGIENKAPVDLSDPDPTSPTDGSEPSIDLQKFDLSEGTELWIDWDSDWEIANIDGVVTATNGDQKLTGDEALEKLSELQAEQAAADEAAAAEPAPPAPGKDDGSSGDPGPATGGGVDHPGWDGSEGGDPAMQDELRRLPGERITPIEGDIDYHDEGYGDGGGEAGSTSQEDLTQPVGADDTGTFGSGTNGRDPAPIDYGPDHVDDPSEPGSYIDPTTDLGGDNVTIELDDGSIDGYEQSDIELDDGSPVDDIELIDGPPLLLDAAE